jgi:xanthine dehydrogenase accessory factor
MVCGGSLSVLIETFVPSPEPIALFNALLELEKEGRRAFLVSKIEGDSKSDFTTQKWLIPCKNKTAADTDSMTHQVPKALLDAIQDNQFSGSSPVIYNHGMDAYIIEPISMRDKIYIFGAGHVGFQMVRMAQITDFQTIVIDDREEFANRQRFPHVEALHVVDHFDHAFDNLAIDGKSYIVILTRGHLYDQIVLEAAIKTDAAYIGMIGSRTKRDKIYANLERKGISRETLSSVHSPIGLDINSETPAEIAVSIIGEIIKVRRG